MCDTKESCIVDASRDMFGHSECSDKVDSDMKLWIMYRCDGGQESNQVTSPADTITRQALTPPPTPVEKITGKTATPPTTNTITHQSSTFPTSPDVTTTP